MIVFPSFHLTTEGLDAAVHAEPGYRSVRVAAAKAVFGEPAGVRTRCAHSVRGVTRAADEYLLRTWTRRLWSWQDEFGTTDGRACVQSGQLAFPGSAGASPVLTLPLIERASTDTGESVPW